MSGAAYAHVLVAISEDEFHEKCVFDGSPFVRELAWYRSSDSTLLSMIGIDNIDHDYSYVIVAPDLRGTWRAIDMGVSLVTQETAFAELAGKVEHQMGHRRYSQGDEGDVQ